MAILLNNWFRHGHIKCTFFVLFEDLSKAVGISLYYNMRNFKNAREPSRPWESQLPMLFLTCPQYGFDPVHVAPSWAIPSHSPDINLDQGTFSNDILEASRLLWRVSLQNVLQCLLHSSWPWCQRAVSKIHKLLMHKFALSRL